MLQRKPLEKTTAIRATSAQLIQDVFTYWNSSHLIVEWILKQHTAVHVVLSQTNQTHLMLSSSQTIMIEFILSP